MSTQAPSPTRGGVSPLRIAFLLSRGIFAQGISSGTNFIVLVAVARSLSAESFGAFSLIMSIALLLMAIARTFTVEPLLIARDEHRDGSHLAERRATGLTVYIAVAVTLGFLIAGRLCDGELGAGFTACAMFVPFIFLQDSLRYVYFARGKPLGAGVLDAVWCACVAVQLFKGVGPTVVDAVVLWASGALVSAGLGVVLLRLVPTYRGLVVWVRSTIHLSLPYLGEYLVNAGASQAVMILLAAVAGLEAVGAARAGYTVYGPLNVLFGGGYLVIVPVARHALQTARAHARRLFIGVSVAFALLAGAWAVGVATMPDRWGTALFGQTWAQAAGLTAALGWAYVFTSSTSGAVLALRGAGAATLSLWARVVALPFVFGLPLIGALVGAAPGFAVGTAVSSAMTIVIWWVFAIRGPLAEGWKIPVADRRSASAVPEPLG